MIDCKCSFSITLITEDFACEHAQLVSRRAGPDIACASEQASENCQQVFTQLKQVGLAAFDVEDDLLKTPASVFAKIQFGGLLGLAKLVGENETPAKKIDNIFKLIEQVLQQSCDYQELSKDMTSYKIKRQKRTRK